MLNIFRDIYRNIFFKIAIIFIVFFILLVFILKEFIDKNYVWFEIFSLFCIVFSIIVFLLYRFYKRLNEDIDTLVFYLKKIDKKDYDSKIEITNYIDFLEISLLLKNLVKRLHSKDKKSKKKKS